jgi:hypothetical protein
MYNQMSDNTKKRIGFWFLIGFGVLLNIVYVLGQTMAIINYDFAVSIDLQESVNEITEIGVALNKGFGFGDTVFYIPLFVIGIIGLLKRSAFGLFAMFGAMAITVYWPIVGLSTVFFAKGAPGWHFTDYSSYSILLSLIALYGIWGCWFLYKYRGVLVKK